MKKILALVLALAMALCAMSISVFAEDLVIFDNADGEQVTATTDPWDGFGLGIALVNGSHVGDMPVADVVAYAEADATLVMVYSSTGLWGGASHPEIEFNVWEAEELSESIAFELVENEDGTITGTVNLGDVLDSYIAQGGDVAAINDCGIQLWGENFLLHKLYITTDATVEAPATEEAPAEEVEEVPAEEEAPATEEAPAEETEPAETGLALAVVPMLVAAAAVVVSKKR